MIYLTFDTEYENGNTQLILDALNKHNVSATFFVTGNYLESAPELVKQMVEDGHFVGNHTYHNLHMSSIFSKESFEKEMRDVEDKFKEITGTELTYFYRPPQGTYNTNNLAMAKKMGYHTFSGVLPTWTGIRINSRQRRKPLKNLSDRFIQEPSFFCIALLRQTVRFLTNCYATNSVDLFLSE